MPPQTAPQSGAALRRGSRLRATERGRYRCAPRCRASNRRPARYERHDEHQVISQAQAARPVHVGERDDERQGRGEHLRTLASARTHSGSVYGGQPVVPRQRWRTDIAVAELVATKISALVPAIEKPRPLRPLAHSDRTGCSTSRHHRVLSPPTDRTTTQQRLPNRTSEPNSLPPAFAKTSTNSSVRIRSRTTSTPPPPNWSSTNCSDDSASSPQPRRTSIPPLKGRAARTPRLLCAACLQAESRSSQSIDAGGAGGEKC